VFHRHRSQTTILLAISSMTTIIQEPVGKVLLEAAYIKGRDVDLVIAVASGPVEMGERFEPLKPVPPRWIQSSTRLARKR
jgi:hypothetical protein